MLSRKLFYPLVAGIAVGTIQGIIDASANRIGPAQYLTHRLYNTASVTLASAVNPRVLVVCLLCCILWLMFAVRRRLRGWSRRIPDIPIIVLLLLIARVNVYHQSLMIYGGVLRIFRGVNIGVFRDVMAEGAGQIAACIAVLLIGVFVLRRMKRTPSDEAAAMPKFSEIWSVMVTPFVSAVRYLGALHERYRQVDAAIVALFLIINALPWYFSVRNGRALRDRPNIILIQIDTLRADHVGCYGYHRNVTPNIDALAAQSIRFDKAIAAAPWTSPSVAAFMSSQILRMQLDVSTPQKPPMNTVFIAEALKDRGYATMGVSSNMLAGVKTGFSRGFDRFDETVSENSSPAVLSAAVKGLNEVKDKRFFMYLLFMDPHSPYILHDKYNYYPGYKGKLGKRIDSTLYEKGLSPDDMKYTISLYDSAIAYTDEHIGRLIDELKRMNLYNDTLIVLLADHGEEFGDHGLVGHGKHLYDESLSVPLIIKLPGQKKSVTASGVFPLLDLFPSLMDYLNLDTKALGLSGLARALSGITKVRDTDIYSSTDFAGVQSECIRTRAYKLIVDGSNEGLYDLQRDSGEKNNLVKSYESTAGMLRKTLKDKDQDIDRRLLGAAYEYVDPFKEAETRQLRSLGYLQ